ncbi:MFS transporter [Micromonospora okii]|uniref:MFS transporter n=1 Tax=Micromonospora okii TaxID=1182970 RepID=UPI001E50001C|nr:MFS transporter [Micromonospora okii]
MAQQAEEKTLVQGTAPPVPGHYWVWLGGVLLSLLGSQIMAFGMTWIAAEGGGALAGLVLTAITLPRVLLLLLGGALADRIGPWRIMITADVTMAVATILLGGALLLLGTRPGLLLAAAFVIGVVDAFYLPSSGSMPRRLVPDESLPRAMSARQVIGQLAAFVGPSAGGLVVATAGLAAAAFANAGTFAVMAFVLVALRPRALRAAPPPAPGGTVLRQAADGLRVAWTDPLLRPALALTAVAAGFLLPVSGMLVALLAHQRHWTTRTGGVLAGAIALGMVGVAVLVTVRGVLRRPGSAAAVGLVVAAAGTLALALAPTAQAAVGAAAVVGVGSGLFSTHIGPLILGGSPAGHLSRLQSVLVLTQSVPLLLANNALGTLTDATTASTVLVICSVVLASTAALALTSPPLRTTTPT